MESVHALPKALKRGFRNWMQIFSACRRRNASHAVEGYTTTLLVLLLIGSAIMLSLGIIGYYIAKIYEEVKRRPRYIVSRIMRGGEDISETARHDGR